MIILPSIVDKPTETREALKERKRNQKRLSAEIDTTLLYHNAKRAVVAAIRPRKPRSIQ